MDHPAPFRPEEFAIYQPDRMGKSTLFASDRLLVGLNAFEPGQEHRLHSHHGMDKMYYVLEGEGEFLLEGKAEAMEPGIMLIAPADAPHGIRNSGSTRLLVLAILAPAP
jgi:quercetin dioxygenase-like cupin family protein